MRNAQVAETHWHYSGEERPFPGNGICQHCHAQVFDPDHPEQERDTGWTLLAPDHHGMPGETLIVGEWCSKECFEADISAQANTGKDAQSERTTLPITSSNKC